MFIDPHKFSYIFIDFQGQSAVVHNPKISLFAVDHPLGQRSTRRGSGVRYRCRAVKSVSILRIVVVGVWLGVFVYSQ